VTYIIRGITYPGKERRFGETKVNAIEIRKNQSRDRPMTSRNSPLKATREDDGLSKGCWDSENYEWECRVDGRDSCSQTSQKSWPLLTATATPVAQAIRVTPQRMSVSRAFSAKEPFPAFCSVSLD